MPGVEDLEIRMPSNNVDKPSGGPTVLATASKTTGKVSYFRLFRFADKLDVVLYIMAFSGAAANGVVFPAFTFIMGELMDAFFDPNGLAAAVTRFCLYMLVS